MNATLPETDAPVFEPADETTIKAIALAMARHLRQRNERDAQAELHTPAVDRRKNRSQP